jgi:hypothetical protein
VQSEHVLTCRNPRSPPHNHTGTDTAIDNTTDTAIDTATDT